MNRLLRLILLGGLLVGGSSPAWGQETPRFGFTLGFNLATLQAPEAELGVRPAYAAGMVVRQGVYGPVALQAELLLNQKGAAVKRNGNSIRYGAAYLDLPALVHLSGPTIKSVTLHGEAGGFGALKVFERQRPGGGLNVPLSAGTSFFNRFDAGVLGGIGATMSLGDRRLVLTTRYAWGLMDVARDLEDQPFPAAPFPTDAQTQTWSLLIRLGL